MSILIYFLCFLLIFIGIFCMMTKKNILKIVIGLVIIEYAVNLFIVVVGYKAGAHAPILEKGAKWLYVDPLSQALALISIVIGLATLSLLVSLCVRLYENYGTLDITEIRKLKG